MPERPVGIIAGAFDVIHPGYILAFLEAKRYCRWLTVCLHTDPSLENKDKLKPVLTVNERRMVLQSIRYVDEVLTYRTESDFLAILRQTNPDIRFLGMDYNIGIKAVTGAELNIPIHYLDRSHEWSATKMKTLIYEQMKGRE